jgi:hypothetical protein
VRLGGACPPKGCFAGAVAAKLILVTDTLNTYEYNIDTDMLHTIHTHTYTYIHHNSDTYRYIQIHTDTYRYIQIHTDMHPCKPVEGG